MIRVSGLHEQLEAAVTERSADGLSAPEQLRMVREIVLKDAGLAMKTLTADLQPRLAEAGVRILEWDEIEPERCKELAAYFDNVVFPVLTPLAFDPAHPFPFVSNLSLSLAVELSEKKEKRAAFARVKVPPSLSRFVPVPGRARQDPRVRPAREARRSQPRPALPRHGDPRRLGLPRHPRRRHRDPGGRGRRPPAQRRRERAPAALRRGDPPRGRGAVPRQRARAAAHPARARSRRRLRGRRAARRRGPAVGPEARPARAEGPALPAGVARDLQAPGETSSTRSARATSCSTSRTTRSTRCSASWRKPPSTGTCSRSR